MTYDSEQWQDVLEWEGLYAVSSAGRVKSLQRTTLMADGRKRNTPERILTPVAASAGYLKVALVSGSRKATRWVHRLVLEAFTGSRPAGFVCRHLDGVKANNNASNLKWGTHKENQADRLGHGTAIRGESVHTNRLTLEQVLAIKKDCRSSIVIGIDYGVSQSTIRKIRSGINWKWVSAPLLTQQARIARAKQ